VDRVKLASVGSSNRGVPPPSPLRLVWGIPVLSFPFSEEQSLFTVPKTIMLNVDIKQNRDEKRSITGLMISSSLDKNLKILCLLINCRKTPLGIQDSVRHTLVAVPSWSQFIHYLVQDNDKVFLSKNNICSTK